MNNVRANLPPPAQAASDFHKLHSLRNRINVVPAPTLPAALDVLPLQRELPVQYSLKCPKFEPKPRRSLLARFINYVLRPYS